MELWMNYGLWIILGICAASAVLVLMGMSFYNRYKMVKEQLQEAMKHGKPGTPEREAWEKEQRELDPKAAEEKAAEAKENAK